MEQNAFARVDHDVEPREGSTSRTNLPRGRNPVAYAVWGLRAVSAALMLAVVAFMNVEVLLRFFLNLPLAAVSEISTLLFFWLSMLGAALAVPAGAHMVVQPLRNRLGRVGCRALDAISTCSLLAVGAFLLVSGAEYTASVSGEIFPVMGMSPAWQAAAFPVSGGLVIFFTIARVFSRAQEPSNPNAVGEKPV